MNWIKENKFLAGFLGVMIIGIGVLGYLLFGAMGRAGTAQESYIVQANELTRLQNLPFSATRKNLDALIAQRTEASKAIEEFQTTLGAQSFPLVPMSPEEFQDKLKATKTAVSARAAEGSTKLPEKFFLGFDAYETRPPAAEAAAPLGRQLKAIEWVLNQAFANHIVEIDGKEPMKRQALAEESGRKAEEPPKRGGMPAPKQKPLVITHSFELKMLCRQQQLAGLLNAIVGPNAPQFYIPRVVQITNDKPKVPKAGPLLRDAEGKPVDNKPGGYVLGNESLNVTLVIDVVDFTPPASAAKATAGN